jgi:hypothetical protein
MKLNLPVLLSTTLAFTLVAAVAADDKIKLTITGGHETDPRDHGRPVVLVANGLGVTPEVFRDAFSRVTPAHGEGGPSRELAQRNKSVLMAALGKYGINNDLLDRVSNFYRYQPQKGGLWSNTTATAYATVKDGAVTSIVVSNAGAGYSSAPTVTIPDHPEIKLKAAIAYGKELQKNGSISAITIEKPDGKR